MPPSSKSQNIRALFFALLAGGQSTLHNILVSEDMIDAVRVCRSLGAEINQQANKLTIKSSGLPLPKIAHAIFSGNSGITTRFALPLLGYRDQVNKPVVFDCGEQMRARPIQTLVAALTNLGMSIEYIEKHGSFPLKVTGRLRGGRTEVGGLSSQYLSALLIAAPCAESDSEIIVKNLHERPYMEMTLNWLKQQNIQYRHEQSGDHDLFIINGQQHYQPFEKSITGDFSSASYLIAAGALLGGTVELQGLDMRDPQGDKRLVEILQQMGADIRIEPSKLIIAGGKPLRGITIDANDIPDLLPTLAVIGTQAEGHTAILNVAQARIKETDRIHSITQGLSRMGAKVQEHADGLTVYPCRLKGNSIQGYGDHRTVMAMSLAGLLAQGTTQIDDADAIEKTFPSFVKIMQSLGANMELQSALK
ncbi:MAG: 3-phosphoshikimate 1-carboxyvinyltransferase [Proteobacteria bacterium]|nr:3-phosphoshikimate 1-carboxyvinyltransferase [Pseudomonadota bacterium]